MKKRFQCVRAILEIRLALILAADQKKNIKMSDNPPKYDRVDNSQKVIDNKSFSVP